MRLTSNRRWMNIVSSVGVVAAASKLMLFSLTLLILGTRTVVVVNSFAIPEPWIHATRMAILTGRHHPSPLFLPLPFVVGDGPHHEVATTVAGSSSLTTSMIPSSLFISTDRVMAIAAENPSSSSISSSTSLLSDATEVMTQAATAATATATNGLFGDGTIIEVVQNVLLGITAIIFCFAGITYLAAAILIPAGAQQLEVECTALIPDIWAKYQTKLENGQSMKDRPDLMFELGLELNKAKAEQAKKIALQYYPDLWDKYQDMLIADQELRDRPELIEALSREMGERATAQMKANCPPDLWSRYEAQCKPGQQMKDRPDLLAQLSEEMGYQDMFAATKGGGAASLESKGQWEDDDNDDSVVDGIILDAEIVTTSSSSSSSSTTATASGNDETTDSVSSTTSSTSTSTATFGNDEITDSASWSTDVSSSWSTDGASSWSTDDSSWSTDD